MAKKRERWLPVVGFKGYYEVSNLGRVRSLDRIIRCADGRKPYSRRGRTLRPTKTDKSYPHVILYAPNRKRGVHVHRLVAEAFLGKSKNGHQCRHRDGNMFHSKLSNLRWGTPTQNCDDKRAHGTIPLGEDVAGALLTAAKVASIKRALRRGVIQRRLSEKHHVSPQTISAIAKGKNWNHVKI